MTKERFVALIFILYPIFIVSCHYNRIDKPLKSRVSSELNQLKDAPQFQQHGIADVLRNVYRSKSSIFPYYDTYLASQVENFEPEFDFVDEYDMQDDNHYHYFSGNIMDDLFDTFRKKLNFPKRIASIIADHTILNKLTANLWIGEAGVIAPTHYDAVYNVYMQLEGNKTFTLLPPSEVHRLQVHGRMHPYACQSRFVNISAGYLFKRRPFCITGPCVDPAIDPHKGKENNINDEILVSTILHPAMPLGQEKTEEKNTGLFDDRSIVRYTLQPGDVLVIPPFWFHEVLTHSDALAVSLWWDAAELDFMDDVYALPLPLEKGWEEGRLLHVVKRFATETLRATVDAVAATISSHCNVNSSTLSDVPGIAATSEQLRAAFTVESVWRLLKIRYQDDVIHRYMYHDRRSTTETTTETVQQQSEQALDKKALDSITNAAQVRAALFSARFLDEEEVYVPREALRLPWDSVNAGEEQCEGEGEGEGTQCEAVDDCASVEADMDAKGDGTHPSLLPRCRCDQSKRRHAVLRNQIAVLSIKLCDYIEDVFRHVSEMLLSEGSLRFRKEDGSARSLNIVAVSLMLEWLTDNDQIR